MVNEHSNVGVRKLSQTYGLWVYLAFHISAYVLFSTDAYAEGYYELVDGKEVEVCEAYEKNLNSFKPKVPMVCGRAINKNIEGFGEPRWTQPNPEDIPSGKAIYEFYLMFGELLWKRDVNPVNYYLVNEWPKWLGSVEQMASARARFDAGRQTSFMRKPWLSEFDIDNDGEKEPVYFEQPCGSVYGSLLAVLTRDYMDIDRKKTELVMPHPPLNRKGREVFRPLFPGERSNPYDEEYGYTPVESAFNNVHYYVFYYKGKTYFDQWWRAHQDFKGKSDIDAGLLRVFQAHLEGTAQICSYRFKLKANY